MRRASMNLWISVLTGLSLTLASVASARPGGISGYSGKNGSTCTSCHDGGAVPTVTLSGPSSLTAGASAAYSLTITGGPARFGSLDVASDSAAALLGAGSGTLLLNGEVTHTSGKAFSGGSVSWQFTVKAPSAAGTFKLYAAGLSSDGSGTGGDGTGSTSKVVTVTTVAPNQPPSVALTSPAAGSSFTAPANILLNATASDVDGSVAKVEFYAGTTKVGEDLTAPYSFTWSGAMAGSYSLTAKATDNLGATTVSRAVTIAIAGAPPPPVIDAGTPRPPPPPPPPAIDAGRPPPSTDAGSPCASQPGLGLCGAPHGDEGDDGSGERQDDLSQQPADNIAGGCAAMPGALLMGLGLLAGLFKRRR